MRENQAKRSRVEDVHSAFVAEEKIVKEHAQWWSPVTKAHWDVAKTSPLEGFDTADQ